MPRVPMPRGRAPRFGMGGLLLLLLLFVCTRGDLLQVMTDPNLQNPGAGPGMGFPGEVAAPPPLSPPGGIQSSPDEERTVDFVSFVLDDLQATWARLLPGYEETKLVLFRDAVRSGCGMAASQMGPFYCPADKKVYIDLDFYDELQRRFGAPGDFAQAYVLAHEVGHHIQRITGIEAKVRQLQRQRPDAANQLSVRMELQADCLAGVWGHSTAQRNLLEHGDIEEGLNAASAIGDDNIQRQTTGRVSPDGFTHGSSEQRVHWFRKGLESGDPDACNTFDVAGL